jgi:hypothetical protein
MGYSESKLKNLPLAQFTLRVVSVASRNSPSLSLSAASSAADCSVQGEDHTTFSVFLQLFEAKINCPLNLRDCSLPSAAPTATHKKSPVRGCGLTGQVTSALKGGEHARQHKENLPNDHLVPSARAGAAADALVLDFMTVSSSL